MPSPLKNMAHVSARSGPMKARHSESARRAVPGHPLPCSSVPAPHPRSIRGDSDHFLTGRLKILPNSRPTHLVRTSVRSSSVPVRQSFRLSQVFPRNESQSGFTSAATSRTIPSSSKEQAGLRAGAFPIFSGKVHLLRVHRVPPRSSASLRLQLRPHHLLETVRTDRVAEARLGSP